MENDGSRRSRNARRKGRTRGRLLVIDPSIDGRITNCCRTSFSNSKNRRQVAGKRWEEGGTRERKTYSDAHLEGLLVPGRAFLLFFGIIIKVGARCRSPIRVSRFIIIVHEYEFGRSLSRCALRPMESFRWYRCWSNDSDKKILLSLLLHRVNEVCYNFKIFWNIKTRMLINILKLSISNIQIFYVEIIKKIYLKKWQKMNWICLYDRAFA